MKIPDVKAAVGKERNKLKNISRMGCKESEITG